MHGNVPAGGLSWPLLWAFEGIATTLPAASSLGTASLTGALYEFNQAGNTI